MELSKWDNARRRNVAPMPSPIVSVDLLGVDEPQEVTAKKKYFRVTPGNPFSNKAERMVSARKQIECLDQVYLAG